MDSIVSHHQRLASQDVAKIEHTPKSELGDSKVFSKDRAKTAGQRYRTATSSHYTSVILNTNEDDEEIARKLEDYESMLAHAEALRRQKLNESIDKAQRNNELL